MKHRQHDLAFRRITRIALGTTFAVWVSYGLSWPLYYVAPIFAFVFLSAPAWPGLGKAAGVSLMLAVCLMAGLVISEFFLAFPAACIAIYALLFFLIYLRDTADSSAMAGLFMTLGITLVPLMGLSGRLLPHVVATGLMMDLLFGLATAWLFHLILPEAYQPPQTRKGEAAPAAPMPAIPAPERIRLALVSTSVALLAVTLFFSLGLWQYSLAMLYICFMVATPSSNASIQAMKANALATCIGGAGAIVAYNVLAAGTNMGVLLLTVMLTAVVFMDKLLKGSKAFGSGFVTFLILLGSSTGGDGTAGEGFYLRLVQILFAGLFAVMGIVVMERITRGMGFRLSRLSVPWGLG